MIDSGLPLGFYRAMASVFIDAERLRNPDSGLGQVCIHLGHQLLKARPEARSGEPWNLTYLVPRGRTGFYGPDAAHIEATWLRKLWIPGRYDVWHCLHQDSVYLPTRSKLVLTIYDLNFLERSDYSAARKARRLAALQRRVDRASVVTAASEFTATTVRQHLRIAPAKSLRVVYTGVAVRQSVTATAPPPFVANGAPFLLFVGAIHPRKNLGALLPVLTALPEHQLVLAGPDHHPIANQLREQAREAGLASRLAMPGRIDEDTKSWLYAHCEALVFPSLSEGFGLPAVEAMAFGKPVFLSRLTSLPEIGGDDAYYFEDFAPASMARTIREGLRDFAGAMGRAERLKARAARFSWQAVAAEYWDIYQELEAATAG